jgi:ubiquinone/menaquinone biosynthesis C-methylase UbiE
LLQAGADAYGVEYDAEKVALGLHRRPELSGRLGAHNLESIGFRDGTFDIALANEVLEHVTDEARALEEIRRVLADHGMFFVFSPNRLHPFETHSVVGKSSTARFPFYLPFVPYIPTTLGRRVFRYVARNYWP